MRRATATSGAALGSELIAGAGAIGVIVGVALLAARERGADPRVGS